MYAFATWPDLTRVLRRTDPGEVACAAANNSFRTVVRDLGLTPNQVWGLTKTDGEWSARLRPR